VARSRTSYVLIFNNRDFTHGNIPKKEMYRRQGKESLMPVETCYMLGNFPLKELFESPGGCLFFKNPKERTKQREHLNNEVASMDKLFERRFD
jgi:hypothetical protein